MADKCNDIRAWLRRSYYRELLPNLFMSVTHRGAVLTVAAWGKALAEDYRFVRLNKTLYK